MGWLAFGAAYSVAYALIGAYFRPSISLLPWFRIIALLIPPMIGVAVIVRRRHVWAGCQWLGIGCAAVAVRAPAISSVHRHAGGRLGRRRSRLAAHLPPARDRAGHQPHHADIEQRRDLAGFLSKRVAWRRDVDSAVRVLS